MKKAVLILAALCVVSSFAFAEVTIGAWGRGLFIPALGGGNDVMTAMAASWGSSPRIGITIAGKSDNVGFQIDMNCDGVFSPGTLSATYNTYVQNQAVAGVFAPATDLQVANNYTHTVVSLGDGSRITPGDQQKIWVKLFNMLTIQVGNFFDDTLRGNAAFGAWNWVRFSNIVGEDLVFERVDTRKQDWVPANIELALAPVEGLYIFAALNGVSPTTAKISDVVTTGQYGAGYTIAGIGMIRVQYLGQAVTPAAGAIQGAFKLTAVPGLTVDIGGTYYTASGAATVADVALFASYALDALTINAEGVIHIASAGGNMSFNAGVGLDYNVGGGIGLVGDFRYNNDGSGSTTASTIGFLLGVTMGFSNGVVGIGFEGTTANFTTAVSKTDPAGLAWCIPIRVEYWF